MRGMRIIGDRVVFTGFPNTETNKALGDTYKALGDTYKALGDTYKVLADLMVRTALDRGWIKPEAKATENEKYFFRAWLNSIGMRGDQYKAARKELLKHFEGNSAFRTEEQLMAFYERHRKSKDEPDFVVL